LPFIDATSAPSAPVRHQKNFSALVNRRAGLRACKCDQALLQRAFSTSRRVGRSGKFILRLIACANISDRSDSSLHNRVHKFRDFSRALVIGDLPHRTTSQRHPPGHQSSTRRSRDKNTTSRNPNRTDSQLEEFTMLTKTKIALAAALVVGSASVALADGEFDSNLGNRYPAYNGGIVAQGAFNSAPVALHRNGHLRSAPVRLQAPGYYGQGFRAGTFGEPTSQGGDHLPGAFYEQEQPGYPQSLPSGGGN
jgi:hypothetical protein